MKKTDTSNDPEVILEPVVERGSPVVGTSSIANPISYPNLNEKISEKSLLVEEEPEDVYSLLADKLESQKAQASEEAQKNSGETPGSKDQETNDPGAASQQTAPPTDHSVAAPQDVPQPKQETAPENQAKENQSKDAGEEKTPTADEIEQILRESETKDDKFLPRKTGQRIARLREITQRLSRRLNEVEAARNEEKKSLDELKKKLESFESSQHPNGELSPKQLERLSMLERRFEIESSEDVKKMFDTPLEQLKSEVSEILDAANISKDSEVANEFSTRGASGVARDYPEVFEGVLALLENGSVAHGIQANTRTRLLARKLENLAVQDEKIRAERARWIESQAKAADEYFKNEREKSEQLAKNAQALIEGKNKEREAAYANLITHELFAYPKDAHPEKISVYERAKQIAKIALDADDSSTRSQIALLAAAAEIKNTELKSAHARIAELEAQLNKLKSANRTVPSTSSLDKGGEKTKSQLDFSTPDGFTDWSAFARYLETNKNNNIT